MNVRVVNNARPWTYEDGRRPKGHCYDCGLPYGSKGWCDVVVSNETWEKINPTRHKGAGLLCFNCIARRLELLGLADVPFLVTSGPYLTSNALAPGADA